MVRRLLAPGMALLLLAAASAPPAGSQPIVGFQGRLTDAGGNPVTSTVTAIFTLYDAETGGSAVWTESRSVAVTGGLYSVLLGEGTALDPAAFNQPLWLGIAVDGDPEMTPRYRLASAPYALMAKQAESVSGLQGRPVSAAAPTSGQVLKWDGAAWAPAADAGTTYGAGSGLTLSGMTFAADYAGSGGDLGSALTLARSDHLHDARYYTEGEIDTALAGKVSKAGDTMTGALEITAPGASLTVTHNVAIGGTLTVVGNAASATAPTEDNHLVTLGYANSNFIRSGNYITSTTAVLDFPSVSNNDTEDLEMAVPNVQPGDSIALGIPPEVMPGGVFVIAFVSRPGFVKIRYGVIGIGGGYNPPSATFRVTVFRYS